MAEKKGILAVSFGTSYERARKEAIDAVEEQWRSVFPDCELRRAFTSPRIIRKLAAQGLSVPDVAQALKGMEAEGFTHVWVQPTLLIPGEEYDRLCEAVKVLEHDFTLLKIGEPLLCQEEDYDNAVRTMVEKSWWSQRKMLRRNSLSPYRQRLLFKPFLHYRFSC